MTIDDVVDIDLGATGWKKEEPDLIEYSTLSHTSNFEEIQESEFYVLGLKTFFVLLEQNNWVELKNGIYFAKKGINADCTVELQLGEDNLQYLVYTAKLEKI